MKRAGGPSKLLCINVNVITKAVPIVGSHFILLFGNTGKTSEEKIGRGGGRGVG